MIGFLIGIFVFISCVIAFSIGFKFGYSVKKGEPPKIDIKAPTKAKEAPSEWEEGFRNIMSYDGSESGGN